MVICPRCFLWSMSPEHVLDVKQPVADFHKRHPGAIGMHKMLYDAMRAVDVISAIAGVDSENIGAVGHSLGAKETLYLSAFDPRVKAAVASEGGIGLTFTNWSDPWYLGSAQHKEIMTTATDLRVDRQPHAHAIFPRLK